MMTEVDFRALRRTVQSLTESTHVVLSRRGVTTTVTHRNSPYVSHRGVHFEPCARDFGDSLVAANYSGVLVVGRDAAQVAVCAGFRPFLPDSLIGCPGLVRHEWVVSHVPTELLRPVIEDACTYGLAGGDEWHDPLVTVAWPVAVVREWDENGRPIYANEDGDDLAALLDVARRIREEIPAEFGPRTIRQFELSAANLLIAEATEAGAGSIEPAEVGRTKHAY